MHLSSKIWEIPQITILRRNSKIVGVPTFRKSFLIFNRRTHANLKFRSRFWQKIQDFLLFDVEFVNHIRINGSHQVISDWIRMNKIRLRI